VFHVTGDEDGEVLADGGTEGVQTSGTADGDGRGAGGDQDAAAAEGLPNGDFPFLVSILLDQLPIFFAVYSSYCE
jgi:hypothetical protein